MSIPATRDLTQVIDAGKTGSLAATCRERCVIHWLRHISRDSRIGVLHRFALIGIGLHRRDEPDAVASALVLDRAGVLRAVDIGIRRGWLLADHGGLLFTFPTQRILQAEGNYLNASRAENEQAAPAKPQVRDGELVHDADGRIQYFHLMSFDSRAVADAFSASVIRTLLEFAPSALVVDEEV
jgi:hypothetical protein